VSKPSFSAFSSASSVVPPLRASAQKAATFGSCASSSLASGWSGEMPMKDAPSSVSGRVV
jgi:anti-sigma factor RsiW